MGPFCSNVEHCHGLRKCFHNVYYGNRCKIPVEYPRPGTCNENYVKDSYPNSPYFTRRACNHDHTCLYNGKCCKRWSSDQIDTCTYPPSFGGIYPGIPVRLDIPRIPEIPVIPYPAVTRPGQNIFT